MEPRRELTLRAVVTGCVIGVLLSAGNVYTSLKIGYIDPGSITAALLGFVVFAVIRVGPRLTALENNISQTLAASAAVTGAVCGFAGPIPAFQLMGREFSPVAIALWGLALGCLGVVVGSALRRRLVIDEDLPFPTGTATAELIQATVEIGGTAARRAGALGAMALAAVLVTFMRDRLELLPQALLFPAALVGTELASFGLGMSVSPIVVGTGVLMGVRGGLSLFAGSVVAWAILAPWLLARGAIDGPDLSSVLQWTQWPAVTLLVTSAVGSLLMDWRSIKRGLGDLRGASAASGGGRTSLYLGLAAVPVVMVSGYLTFGVGPLLTLPAVALAVILAGVCGRAAGETDHAPAGAAGATGQLVMGASSATASLVSGAIPGGVVTQAAGSLWSFRAGRILGASPRSQLLAQLVGVFLGVAVAVPVYGVVLAAYGLGTEVLPAPGALSWRATAEAISGGGTTVPEFAGPASVVAFLIGVLMLFAQRSPRLSQWLPSPVAFGIAFLLPAHFSGAVLVGALVLAVLQRTRASWSAQYVLPVAAGAIAGESLMGVGMAIWMVLG